jgi:Mrp family chromosome partitioning ATPase
MTPGGSDSLKSAMRRSLPIVIGLVLLGVIAVNLFEHLQGNKFQASATVEVSATPLAEIITGVTPPFVDPTETQDTAQTLAGAPQVYRRAAALTKYRYGTAGTLQGDTSVSAVANTDLLSFTATGTTAHATVSIANATAAAYVVYRAQVTGGEIGATIDQLQATESTLPATGAQRAQLGTEIAKLQLLKGSSSTGAVVVQAATSADKTSPKPSKDSAIGFAVGLVIALMIVAFREAIDTKVRTESQVEELLSAPVLASVRTLPRRAQIVTIGRYEPLFGETYALLAAQLATDRRDSEHSILAITSALAGEGKTTTAANLAVAMASRGHAVVLADFDFHKPNLTNMFEIPPGVSGALQVLEEIDTLDDVLWEISLEGQRPTAKWRADPERIEERRRDRADSRAETNGRSDGTGSLLVLPSGKADSADSADARARTGRIGSLLRELSSHAELVIVDTPPALLTVEMTELAQLVDMVLVVVRQGKVSQRTLRSLGRNARSWPAELTGAVITDVPAATSYSSYYGGK